MAPPVHSQKALGCLFPEVPELGQMPGCVCAGGEGEAQSDAEAVVDTLLLFLGQVFERLQAPPSAMSIHPWNGQDHTHPC